MKNAMNYVGWVVPGNLGDEALYRVNQKIFGSTFELYRIKNTTKEKHSQVTLLGGGTCFPQITFWMKPAKYVYVFGVGVEDPSFYGPFDPLLLQRLKCFNFRFVGVRGETSRALLKEWGIESEVIGDPCLSLKTSKVEPRENMKVAITIGAAFSGGAWGSEDRVLREMAKVCRILKKKGYEIVLIPFWTENIPAIRRLSQLEGVSVFNDWFDIEATLQLISKCKLFIGEKLHSLVFSAATNTPFLCLGYAPEHFDFLESVGFSEYGVRTDEISSEKLIELFHNLMNNYEKMQNVLVTRVEEYRERQKKFAVRIISDIESLPENKWALNNGTKILWDTDVFLRGNMSRVWKVWNRLFFLRVMRYVD